MHHYTISVVSPDILRQRSEDLHTKQTAIDLIRKTDSLNFTVSCLQQLEQRLRDKTLMLGGNPGLEYFLSELSVDSLESSAVAAQR